MISDSRREYYKDKFGDKYTNLKDKSISVVFPTEKVITLFIILKMVKKKV